MGVVVSGRMLVNSQAEKSLLGCCIAGGQDAIGRVLDKHPNPDVLFSEVLHTAVWAVLRRLFEDCKPISLETVFVESIKSEDVVKVSNQALLDICDAGPSGAAVDYFLGEASEAAERRRIDRLGIEARENASNPKVSVKAALEALESKMQASSAIGLTAVSAKDAAHASLAKAQERFDRFQKDPNSFGGIPTGWKAFNMMTDGMQKGELILIGARPSQGKSAACINVVEEVCLKQKRPTLFFSAEMTSRAIIDRMVCSVHNMDSTRLRRGELEEGDFKKLASFMNDIKSSPLHFVEGGNMTISDIRRISRRMHSTNGIELIVVDYLQKIKPSTKSEKRTYEVAEVSSGLQWLARELNVPVLCAAQLNRDVEKDKGRRPKMSDLGDSGQIERDADVCALLYRVPKENDGRGGGLGAPAPVDYEMIIAKQREGPCGIVDLVYRPQYTRFESTPRRF